MAVQKVLTYPDSRLNSCIETDQKIPGGLDFSPTWWIP